MSDSAPDRSRRWPDLLWVLLVLLSVLQVWYGAQFPSQDGPIHLYIASMMVEMSEVQQQWFVSNPYPEPNIAVHYLLAGLLQLGVAEQVAEKVLVSLIVLLFAFGARKLLLALGKEPVFAVLPLPFALSYFVHMGFYNFSLGAGLGLWILGFWMLRPLRPSVPRLALLAGLLLLLAVTHLFWLLFCLMSMGVLRTVWAWRPGEGVDGKAWVRDALALLIAALPTIPIVLSFVQRHQIEASEAAKHPGLVTLLLELGVMRPLYSLDRLEFAAALPFLVLVGVLLVMRTWRLLRGERTGAALLVLILLFFALYLLDPLTTKEVPVWQRTQLPLLILVLAFCATQPLGRRMRVAVAGVMALVVLGSGVLRIGSYHRLQKYLDHYVSASERLEPGSIMLAVNLWDRFLDVDGRPLTWRADPLVHTSARVATRVRGVDLRASLLAPSMYGYFPIVFAEGRDPYVYLKSHIEWDSRNLDLRPAAAAGIAPDAVLLFDPRAATPLPPDGRGSRGVALRARLPAGDRRRDPVAQPLAPALIRADQPRSWL